jgi:Phospholipase B
MRYIIPILFFAISFSVHSQTTSSAYYALKSDLKVVQITKAETPGLFQNPDYLASATFIDDRNGSGWTYYLVNTSYQQSDILQGYAAGYLEGYLAMEPLYQNFMNQQVNDYAPKKEMLDWINNQSEWVAKMVKHNPVSNYWQLVNVTLNQYNGIYDGYTTAVKSFGKSHMLINPQNFYWVTYGSDYGDVNGYFKYIAGEKRSVRKGHCSFLLKLVEDDLYVSHDTWTDYIQMLKVFKTMNFSFHNPAVQNQVMQFSATPGQVPSIDDFYMLSNNRVVIETTIDHDNHEIFSFLHYETVPYWIRINVANLAYDTQTTWMNYFFSYRSGTYNNQWLVIDFNQYLANKNNLTAASNIIWMIEEFYKMTSALDVTQTMLIPDGYVASYNTPFNPMIEAYSGTKTGDTYDTAPRFFLFERYAPFIQNIQNFQTVMRMNNYSDFHNFDEAIAARFDLLSGDNAFPFGAIDSKVTAASLISNMQAWIVLGPTNQNVPAFSWNDWPKYDKISQGMPRVYNFDWTFYDPATINTSSN